MSDLQDLNRKRGTCKCRLTNFEKYLSGFTNVSRCTDVQILEIKFRITKMEENFLEFEENQSSIERIVDDEDIANQELQRSEFESQYYSNMARAQELLSLHKRKYLTPVKSSSSKSNTRAESSSSCSEDEQEGTVKQAGSASTFKGVKLPTIQIPKFSGEYNNWLEFRDTFVSLIHDNKSISCIQKFHYLRASLEGGAAQVIRALVFSSSNYDVAWSSLCDRYDNTRLLIQNHVKAIFNEEPLKKESADLMRKLLDSYLKNIRALEILGEPTQSWDTLLIYIISSKLDARTLREWEEQKIRHKQLTLEIFTKFLKNRADLLETIELSTNKQQGTAQHTQQSYKANKSVKALAAAAHPVQYKTLRCPLCNDEHSLYRCERFSEMNVDDRLKFVYQAKLCANCFKTGHNKRACRLGPCKTCKRKHNTLLHREDDESSPSPTTALAVSHHCGQVLLATAIVKIRDTRNNWHEVRAVLDSGSQASFMTESLVAKLSLNSQPTNFTVAGINNAISPINKKCNLVIQSRLNDYQANVIFLVLPYITSSTKSVDARTLQIPQNIPLADPDFYSPSSLDLLLGADIFWDLLGTNQIRVNKNYPVLQETKLGYIVSGPTGNPRNSQVACNLTQFEQIQDQLARFWAIEELPESGKPALSIEETLCEENFTKNMTRKQDGRFSVAIPLRMPETALGESFHRAKQCFLALERRFQKQVTLKSMYIQFMEEYASLGHMTRSDITNPPQNSYFLPHHGVLREQSATTKLRAVFNASAPTTSGLSLNDIQMVGPTIQSDLLSILLRFRQHRYVMAGDIEKMYRQVLIHENQRHLLQIIWRDNPAKPLETYTLNTVTYGTAAAPFLAIRCLKQLADECEDDEISKIISDDFYVDDLITGHVTAEGLMQIKSKVTQVLASGCFNLRKFRSNLPICNEPQSSEVPNLVDLKEQNQSSALGLKWSPDEDQLRFVIKENTETKVTKRVILSTISQVFDPLGLLSIFLIAGKIILQKLWLHKLQWDDPLPREILQLWEKFAASLAFLNELRIPRCVVCDSPVSIQLHVFCDASKDAYGACVYVRSENSTGQVEVHLLCAKSRVAPSKASTIPRLELCGATASAKLISKVLTTTRLTIAKVFLWTDSSVVLGWLKTPPNKLKQYVRNRVAEIQEITQEMVWRHVPTASNPADILSRGITVKQTEKLKLWWNGPPFLLNSDDYWPQKTFDFVESELPEVMVNVTTTNETEELFPLNRFSKLQRLKNVMAYVLRFISKCKSLNKNNNKTKERGPIKHITYKERQQAYTTLLKLSQMETFANERNRLLNSQGLSCKNKLLSMSPFVDDEGLVRVGGRIKNGNFTFDKKHPILLDSKHTLTKLIFQYEHERLMHAGPQLLLSSIREQIWPLGGRNLAKRIVHKCIRCFRFNAKTVNPIMGNLPEQRLQPGYPFQTAGMDYAGPVTILNRRGRGSRTEKAYIALFVCFITKSIHLELVSDLTKDTFLSALRRFIARRSKPSTLVSDNGTQFVGARNELAKFFKDNAESIIDTMSQESIDFKFIPAYTPHMAGLAEAGVKSVKSHLRRVLGSANLVFEDMYTVLVQIEAILNSRPLTSMSTDPHDLTPLTPGHFLVGRPLTALPTPTLLETNLNRLSRFERLEQMRQQFWARWHKEYIGEMQQRVKWRSSKGLLEEGALCLIKDESLPPMKWSLGRVVKTYPGSDGITRVADLRSTKGVVRRAFNKICPLPLEASAEELKGQPSNAGGHVGNGT